MRGPISTGTKASYAIKNDQAKRTVLVRLTGMMDEATMRVAMDQYKRATDEYRGGEHLVFADLQGLIASQDAAEVLGEAIGYGRKRGVTRCVHLSDVTITRLQARRVARENSPGDDVTIDVVSEAEAQQVLAELREQLKK
jgi:hypothetical protein